MPVFLAIIFVGLLVLKLDIFDLNTQVETWSWWWVTVPLWGPAALTIAAWLVILLVGGSVTGLVALLTGRRRR